MKAYTIHTQAKTDAFPWGLDYAEGETYLIYGNHLESPSNLAVSLCGYSQKLSIPVSGTPEQPEKPLDGNVTIWASGDHYLGSPRMRVSIGNIVLAESQIVTAKFGDKPQKFTFPIKDYQGGALKIEFINDAWGGMRGKDRNLYIQQLSATVLGTTINMVDEKGKLNNGIQITGGKYNRLVRNPVASDTLADAAIALHSKGSVILAQ